MNQPAPTAAMLATAVGNASVELWRSYVPDLAPHFAGPQVTTLVGVCTAMVVANLLAKGNA